MNKYWYNNVIIFTENIKICCHDITNSTEELEDRYSKNSY